MFVVNSGHHQLRRVDARRVPERGAQSEPEIWLRTEGGTSLCLSLDEVPWLATALSRAYEEAKAAAPDAVGVLFKMERGRAEAEVAEVG